MYSAKGSDSRLRETLSRATRKNRDQVKPWTVDAHHFKAILFRRLRLTAGSAEPGGPGYMHFCVPTRTGADAEYNTIRPHSSLGYRPPAPEAIQPDPAFLKLPTLCGPLPRLQEAVGLTQ